jgi:hypothetical protein
MTLRTAADEPIVGFAIVSNRRLVYRNNIVNPQRILVEGVQSDTRVTLGEWHELQAHVRIDGDNSLVEVWYDGLTVADLRHTEQLGTTPIGRIQFGESLPNRSFDVVYDDLVVATEFCGSYLETDSDPEPEPEPDDCPAGYEWDNGECCNDDLGVCFEL